MSMTQLLILKAQIREGEQKPKHLRQAGHVPAILYGHKIKNLLLNVDRKAFQKVFDQVHESSIFTLQIGEETKPRNVIIKEVQQDPESEEFLHVDFYQVKMTEKITAEVPLEFSGEAFAVKDLGGILAKNMDNLKVSCLPAHLPPQIYVHLDSLKTFEDIIYVKDLDVPSEIELLVAPDEVVASVTPPRSEEELAQLDQAVEEKVEEVEGVKETEAPAPGAPQTTPQEPPTENVQEGSGEKSK